MQFSSDSAQVEPLAALAAVLAVGVALSLYAGALETAMLSLGSDREMASTAADRLLDETSGVAVVRPPIDDAATTARPAGHDLNATLRADERAWRVGPSLAGAADCERRRVSVRTAPGAVDPGLLEVCVWPAG